jgi:hypothetical protein
MIGPAHRMNYARRQQYRRMSRAAMAAMASGVTVLLALPIASAGAVTATGGLLMFALGLGLYARRCRSPSAAGSALARNGAKLVCARRRQDTRATEEQIRSPAAIDVRSDSSTPL